MRLLAAALVLALAPGASAPRPPEEPAERALRLVKPALVRIVTQATATVSVAVIEFDQRALEAFARRDVADLLASGRRYPSAAIAEQVINGDLEHEFVANPGPYLKLGDRVTDPYDATRTGSGWLADPNGYVVTAADVVLDEAAVTAAASEEERQAIAANLDDLTPADLGLTVPLSDSQKTNIVNAALARVVPSIQVSNIARHTTVQLGSAARTVSDAPTAIVSPAPHGTGLAVVKVPPHQLASVPLALGAPLTQGRPVVVTGYPGVTEGPEANAGLVGDAVEGVWTTDAGFTAGVIGGPVVDADGYAVGVAVKRDGASAIVPTADVLKALAQAHARPAADTVTIAYRKAAADMSKHWYKRALPVLQSVMRRSPDIPWVSDQVQEAAREIALGHDESPSDRPFAPVAAAAVLFAIDAVAVTTVLRRRFLLLQRGTGGVTRRGWSGRPGVRGGPWRRRGRGTGRG